MFSTLSSGERQNHNKLARGYYRTDDSTTQGICHALALQGDKAVLFDPCCGEGIVASDLQKYLGEDECTTYGVEIAGERFKKSAAILQNVLHGDALYLVASSSWASLLFFNPPYDWVKVKDKRLRLEQLFWEAHSSRLIPGGVLVAVLPDYLFYRDAPRMAEFFSNYLQKGTTLVYRADTDKFKQIVVIGYRKKSEAGKALDPDIDLRNLLLTPDAELPALPKEPLATPFLIPDGRTPDTFRINHLTKEYVEMVLAKNPQFDKEVQQFLQTQNALSQKLRSVRQLRDGHIPALLASGGLDGHLEDEQGRFLVRGTVQTVMEVLEGAEAEETQKKTVTTSVRKHITQILAWDLSNFQLIRIS
ncbi:MAG: DUF6094 domain-containing protein [Acidithiobacillus sp.]|nr:DUF6094 domain-containing protein [Acidithiobacillus sp.]